MLDFIIPAMTSLTAIRRVSMSGNKYGGSFEYYRFYNRFGRSWLVRLVNRSINKYRMDDRFLAEEMEFTDLFDPATLRRFYQNKIDKIHNDAFDSRHNKKFAEFVDKYQAISESGDYKKLTAFAIAHPINFAFFKIFNRNFKNDVVNAQVRESYRQEFKDVYGINPTEEMLSEYISRRGRKSFKDRRNTFVSQYFSK